MLRVAQHEERIELRIVLRYAHAVLFLVVLIAMIGDNVIATDEVFAEVEMPKDEVITQDEVSAGISTGLAGHRAASLDDSSSASRSSRSSRSRPIPGTRMGRKRPASMSRSSVRTGIPL